MVTDHGSTTAEHASDVPEGDDHAGRTSRAFGRQVTLVALAALVMRLVLQRFEPRPPTTPILSDEAWYTKVANLVLHGKGFVGPFFPHPQTALHGPLTVFLVMPATLLEPHGYTLQRATIGVLGALCVVAIAYVARELAGPRVGLCAAVLAALYPGLWVNDLVATSETPAVLLLTVTLLLVLRYRRAPSVGGLVLLGVTLGLLALDRAELALLGVLLVVPALLAVARSAPAPFATFVRGALVVGVLAVGIVVPWSAYNQVRFHQTVLISNNLGQTLVGANCSESYYGPLTGYDGRRCYLPVLAALPKGLNEAQSDAFFRHRAITYATNHWHRWPVVAVMRELWLWSLWKPGWTVFMSGIYLGRAQWLAWSQIVGFWLLTPFALYGFFLARRRRVRVAPLVTMVLFTAALGLLVVGHLRYRIPSEIAWVLFGAIAFDRLFFGAPEPRSVGGGHLG
jgi:4-amino-4-deoxy-L-arabinose transferase-like glycosyltransferase